MTGSPFWRGLKRMEQHHRRRILRRLQWASDVCELVGRFIELPPVNLPCIGFDPNSATDADVERSAGLLRDAWGMGRGPVHNLAALSEHNGIIIIREAVACSDMDAVSSWIGGRPLVLMSAEVASGPRDIFNLAHEIGHILLHAGVEVDTHNLAKIERQANRFASAFLLPAETFSQEVLGSSLSYLENLKRRWGASIAAIAYRCKDLGLLSDSQMSYVFRQMNARNMRLVEPLDDVIKLDRPAVLREAIQMIVNHGVYTRAQIESELGLNLQDVESLCGVPEGYLDTRVVRMEFRPTFRDAKTA